MSNQRIYEIRDAATRLFLRQGYSKTQISHIAKEIGVSVGTIYHEFTGKEAIMHFILKCTIAPDFIDQELERPISEALFSGIEEEIIAVFQKNGERFAKNLPQAANLYQFQDLISDAFDLLSRYGAGCLFIEKNYMDCPLLAKHYQVYRKHFFDTMVRYMKAFTEKGVLRPLKHLELSTNLIIEILTWWAMDMRYVSFETWDIPIAQAKEVCLDNILTAYKQ